LPEVAVPDPSLIVLIGAAGAGKTTFARRQFDPAEILSSDAYRAMLAGDEADQRVTRAAFGRLHRDLDARLRSGRLTVVDATNVERLARRALLRLAAGAGIATVAIVLDLPEGVVLGRNAARVGRIIDEAVVRRHLARLRASIGDRDGDATAALSAEGFASVAIIRDPVELDRLRVTRRPRSPGAAR
jgi:predicted kinase